MLSLPQPLNAMQQDTERTRCGRDPVYFINTYCQIYDNVVQNWIPFTLWPAQIRALAMVMGHKYSIALKARQEGFTWLLGVAYPLWQMMFAPIAEVLLFSQRDDEAVAVLERLRGMIQHLPDWLQPPLRSDNDHELRLRNGSGALALPASTGGRSKTATYVFADEGAFIEVMERLMSFVKPTIDPGLNKLVTVSTANDEDPNCYFHRLYKAARDGESGWAALFIGWNEHPGRSQDWYAKEREESFRRDGSYDNFIKQYPATDVEALSARTLLKFFPPQWITLLYKDKKPLRSVDLLTIPGLQIFAVPIPDHHYGIGADPAGGKSDSDDSVACMVDSETGEEVAVLGCKAEPAQFGELVADLAVYYNHATVLFELNNHGHAVRNVLKERGVSLRSGMTKRGPSRDPGWLTTDWSKAQLLDMAKKVMSSTIQEGEQSGESVYPLIYDFKTASQLASIQISDFKAPTGEHDDYAVAWCLAQQCIYRGTSSMRQIPHSMWTKPQESAPLRLPSTTAKVIDIEAQLRYRGGK